MTLPDRIWAFKLMKSGEAGAWSVLKDGEAEEYTRTELVDDLIEADMELVKWNAVPREWTSLEDIAEFNTIVARKNAAIAKLQGEQT